MPLISGYSETHLNTKVKRIHLWIRKLTTQVIYTLYTYNIYIKLYTYYSYINLCNCSVPLLRNKSNFLEDQFVEFREEFEGRVTYIKRNYHV